MNHRNPHWHIKRVNRRQSVNKQDVIIWAYMLLEGAAEWKQGCTATPNKQPAPKIELQ
jgi:hypothetical protein